MSRQRVALSSVPVGLAVKPWIGAIAIALACSGAQAAVLGHSRLASALGQPLRIDIQLAQVAADEAGSLQARPAPASAWHAAGLTPPVDLSSLRIAVVNGYTPQSKIIRVTSSQPFDGPLADLLLDISSASGSQRFQVSLLTQGQSLAADTGSAATSRKPSATAASAAGGGTIRVRRGDTMFSIAERHAVRGVTVYQMMMALQRVNPQAFIEHNVNLVKSGARLTMPGMQELTAISDREARRQFIEQAQAFAAYRQRAAGAASKVGDTSATASGAVAAGGEAPVQNEAAARDELRLSGGPAASKDDEAALRANIGESAERVSQLEENVKHLNQALQAQGGAASSLVVEGARSLSDTLAAVTSGAAGQQPDTGSPSEASRSATTQSSQATGQPSQHAIDQTSDARPATEREPSGAAGGVSTATEPSSVQRNGREPGAEAAAGAVSAAGPRDARPSEPEARDSAAAASSGGASAQSPAGTTSGDSNRDGAQGAGPSNGTAGGTAPGGSPGTSAADNTAASDSAGNRSGTATAKGAGSTSTDASGDGQTGQARQGLENAGGHDTTHKQAGTGPSADSSTTDVDDDANHTTTDIQSASGATPEAGGQGADQAAGSLAAASPRGEGDANPASSDTDSTKAGQTVSWLQEHALGVITGVLALIVLIIAWLLRRANASRGDGRDGVITEAMVQEKLNEINLDLGDSSDTEPPRQH